MGNFFLFGMAVNVVRSLKKLIALSDFDYNTKMWEPENRAGYNFSLLQRKTRLDSPE